MKKEDLLTRITVNPEVMVGKPTIRGLRITVEQILKALAVSLHLHPGVPQTFHCSEILPGRTGPRPKSFCFNCSMLLFVFMTYPP
jgi:hypothetical protein